MIRSVVFKRAELFLIGRKQTAIIQFDKDGRDRIECGGFFVLCILKLCCCFNVVTLLGGRNSSLLIREWKQKRGSSREEIDGAIVLVQSAAESVISRFGGEKSFVTRTTSALIAIIITRSPPFFSAP